METNPRMYSKTAPKEKKNNAEHQTCSLAPFSCSKIVNFGLTLDFRRSIKAPPIAAWSDQDANLENKIFYINFVSTLFYLSSFIS